MNEQNIYKRRAEKALSFYPDLEEFLRDDLLGKITSNSPANVEACVQFIRGMLGPLAPVQRYNAVYWVQLGHSFEQAEKFAYASKIKLKSRIIKNISPFSRQYWTTKINPKTGDNYTEYEADAERNSMRPIRAEYWIKRGATLAEATVKADEVKDRNNKIGAKVSSERTPDKIRRSSKRCSDYWIVRGYNETCAQEEVSKHQVTFSLEKLVKSHGEEVGLAKWKERQNKWQGTLNAKPLEERLRINKAKVGGGGISLEERELFVLLSEVVKDLETQIVFQTSARKRSFVFDIGKNKKLIEFNGDYWHANPKKYLPEDIIKVSARTASDIWAKDAEKIKYAQDQGYEVLTVWESDFKQNKQETLQLCINFLTQ